MRSTTRWMGVLAVVLALGGPGAARAQDQGSADDRAQEFAPVEGGGEVASGEVLLVQAYAAVWLIAFGLILGANRRQKKLDERIESLRAELRRGGGAGGG